MSTSLSILDRDILSRQENSHIQYYIPT
jgi:hypothetical protein